MKTKIQKCDKCKEDTRHDVGKKQGTTQRGAYLKRSTSRCRKCGTRIIKNQKRKDVKTIDGKNQLKDKQLNEELKEE